MEKLKEAFEKIIDVRDSKGKRHNLVHIIIMTVCAILKKNLDFEEIADYAKSQEKWFDEKLNLWNGVPCAGTFRNVFRIIPAEQFLRIFLEWINAIVTDKTGKQIIIDGKSIKAATEKCNNGNTPYIVSGYLADIGISIGEKKVDSKSNEITAIPELLELLEIEGCIITIDAIGTQEKIMNQIKEQKADFVLGLKKNQKGAYEEANNYFATALEKDFRNCIASKKKEDNIEYKISNNEQFPIYITRENSHGRNEERIYIKTTYTQCLTGKKWKHVKNIIKVICNTTIHDSSERIYISSIDLPIEELANIIRKHWQIENNLHWVLDMYFFEDLSRNRKDNSLENLSLLRKMCYNIIKLDDRYPKLSTKRKMNRYCNYPKEFEELLTEVLPRVYKGNTSN